MVNRRVLGITRPLVAALAGVVALAGCKSANEHYKEADKAAAKIIEEKQKAALGRTEPFSIERPADTLRRRLLLGQDLPYSSKASLGTADLPPLKEWPKEIPRPTTQPATMPAVPATQPVRINLTDTMKIAAANSRAYQSAKEAVFVRALSLDLARDEYRNSFLGLMTGDFTVDHGSEDPVVGATGRTTFGVTRQFKNGLAISSRLAIDLVKLLTQDKSSAYGVTMDLSATLPLLRGSGRFIVTEPLTQAERNVVYQIWQFEDYKRTFAVEVASQYLTVLQQLDQIRNAEENYKLVVNSTRRVRRLADAGRQREDQVDQAIQQELRARERWIQAREGYGRRLDGFKVFLGLPPDALIELDRGALEELAQETERRLPRPTTAPVDRVPQADAPIVLVEPDPREKGPYELPVDLATKIAMEYRLDLRTALGEVYDAQRQIVVAADALRMGLDVSASGAFGEGRSLGSAGSPDGRLRPEKGAYGVGLDADLPLERTSERNAYRLAWIGLEQATRALQETEDQVKQDVRNNLRVLLEAREGLRIQEKAVEVARRRVASTTMLLEADRAEVRDMLEAQDALVQARDDYTRALVAYRLAELELQRSLGVLEVDSSGLWHEPTPEQLRQLP